MSYSPRTGSLGLSLWDFGIYGDGVTHVGAAINAVYASLPDRFSLFHPPGNYLCEVPVRLPTSKGTLWSPPSSQIRCGPTVFTAVGGVGALSCIMGTPEYLTNNVTQNGKGLVIDGFSFDGGGISDGDPDETKVETTSKCVDGLVVNGIGVVLKNIFSNSANRYNIRWAGTGINGTTPIDESHECGVADIGCRWAGDDGYHVDVLGMDMWHRNIKTQYSGGHGIYASDAGHNFMQCHPSWARKDIMHFDAPWGLLVIGNYVGGIGAYKDNTGFGPHHGIYAVGEVTILGNTLNDFPPQTTLVDDIYGYGINYNLNHPSDISHNKFYADTNWDGNIIHGGGTARELHEINIGNKGSSIFDANRFIRT